MYLYFTFVKWRDRREKFNLSRFIKYFLSARMTKIIILVCSINAMNSRAKAAYVAKESEERARKLGSGEIAEERFIGDKGDEVSYRARKLGLRISAAV